MNNNTPFWIMLAREGETTDGRHINAETLIALAKSYSPDFYCARVYKSHSHNDTAHPFGELLGWILAAKTELIDDTICLYVSIEPTERWFSVLSEQELEQTQIYPALEYRQPRQYDTEPYIVGVELTTEPVIKNLEPLNKHMVKA
ncbi:MAG: GPO family capsid scaffolding protein [Serratia proteamaculans]